MCIMSSTSCSSNNLVIVPILSNVPNEPVIFVLLRHFEHLSTGDVAEVLGLTKPAAGMRYMRAMRRLRVLLADAN